MASTEHKNRRRAIALERLNLAVLRLASSKGINAIEIPKKTKDKDMREIMIFERMADFLETLGGDSVPRLENNPIVIRQMNRAGYTETAKPQAPMQAVVTVSPASKPKPTRKRKPKQATARMEAK